MKNLRNCILFLAVLTFSACTDLDIESENSPTSATFLTNETELQLAINSAYSNAIFTFGFAYATPTGDGFVTSNWLTDSFTDVAFYRSDGEIQATNEGRPSSAYGFLDSYWDNFYRGIAKCNNILDNMDKAQDVGPEVMDSIEGQALFLRAYYYLHVGMLWGDVPVYLTSPSARESNFPVVAQSEVYAQVLADLENAIPLLPNQKTHPTLVNRFTAQALLSRAALQEGDHQKVISAANDVITNGGYSLEPDYRLLFTHSRENNDEAIFSAGFTEGIRVHGSVQGMGPRKSGGDGWSVLIPTRDIVDSYETINGLPIDEDLAFDPLNPYENRDPRLKMSIFTNGDVDEVYDPNFQFFVKPGINVADVTNPAASFSGFIWKKYVDADGLSDRRNVDLDVMVIRLAEVYLNLAEAQVETGDLSGAVASLNVIRNRAGMPDVIATNVDEVRRIMRRERKVELAGEGLRLFDIRRWRIGESVMPGSIYGRALDLEAWEKNFQVPNIDENGHVTYADESGFQKAMGTGSRTFDPNQDYVWPYPQDEIDSNDGID